MNSETPEASACSVIVVLHNSAEHIRGCIRSVPAGAEVIIVDNASDDDGLALARAESIDARVLKLPRNLGFGAGCNAGARLATRKVLLFLNPDAMLQDGALNHLVRYLERNPDELVGPALLTADGLVRENCRRRSHAAQDVLEVLPGSRRWTPQRLRRDIPRSHLIYERGGDVAYVQGACMALMRGLFEAVRGFDEDLFLYQEEETLAERVRRVGGGCVYLPAARVKHIAETSTSKVPQFSAFHMYRSKILMYGKRDGRLVGLAAAVGILLALATSMALSPINSGSRGPQTFAWSLAAVRGAGAGAIALVRTGTGPGHEW